jgi:hypothetical protein
MAQRLALHDTPCKARKRRKDSGDGQEIGAGDGDRTHDIHLGKVALYR